MTEKLCLITRFASSESYAPCRHFRSTGHVHFCLFVYYFVQIKSANPGRCYPLAIHGLPRFDLREDGEILYVTRHTEQLIVRKTQTRMKTSRERAGDENTSRRGLRTRFIISQEKKDIN